MKITKLLAVLGAAALLSVPLFADGNALAFSLNVQAAYYPESAHVSAAPNTDNVNHFAPLTGPYSGLEGAVTPQVDYTISTPLGDHWLLSGANLKLGGWMQVTPVTVKPGASITFTPMPFLVFSAGGEAGTGWDLGPFKGGMGAYSGKETDYNQGSTFAEWYLKTWFQGTFQFDTGAIIAGDWTHVLMQFTYQAYYQAYTGAKNQELWTWQCSGNRVNGWYEYMCGILGYQLPIPVLKMVGLMFESEGPYSKDAYRNPPEYEGNFKEISLSPVLQFAFTKKDSLNLLIHFKSRRTLSFIGKLELPESDYPAVGREWFFNRLALSYTHTF